MFFNLFLGDEMKSIVSADSKVMLYFFTVFTAVDMEDQFFSCEYMIFVEGAGGFFLILALPEHVLPNIIASIQLVDQLQGVVNLFSPDVYVHSTLFPIY